MKKRTIKTAEEIKNIKEAGKYLNELLYINQQNAKAGTKLLELEEKTESYLKKNNLKWSFKGYQWFPTNLCLSVNDCVVHWIPDDYILKNGDLLKIDCGITYKWNIADAAISIIVGGSHTNPLAEKLVNVTKSWLDHCLHHLKPENTVHTYSSEIFNYITSRGCSVIKALTWHGVGNAVHEPPYIYNRPHPETSKTLLQEGMVLAIEPITAISSEDFVEGKHNNRNLYTKNGDLWAQREYTIHITNNGNEILAWIKDW